MVDIILVLISVALFSLCSRQFIKTMVTPLPIFATERRYALGALKLERAYKAVAWGVMTVVFLSALIISFYQYFTQL